MSPVAISAKAQAVTASTRKDPVGEPQDPPLVATGTAPGLYGGSDDTHVCDPQLLIGFLHQHPDKAAAWTGVLGITSSNIAKYVTALTPVVLTDDTLVTNHGYRDGHATTLQSMLQAGTAVMADATGTPHAKCNCGNPLTTFVTSTDTETFTRAGSIPDRAVVALAYGNGRWLAATSPSSNDTDGAHIFESTDLSTWTDVATLQDTVEGMAYGNGRWVAIGLHTINSISGTGAPHSETVVYTGTNPNGWTHIALAASPGGYRQSIAFGSGGFVASVPGEFDNDNFEFSIGTFASSDGTHSKANGGSIADNGSTAMAYGSDQWIVASTPRLHGTSALYASPDATDWTAADTAGLDNSTLGAIGFGNGSWLAGGQPPTTAGPAPSSSTLYVSTNGTSWSRAVGVDATVTAVAFGADTSGGTTTTTTPSTTSTPTTAAGSGTSVSDTPCNWKDDQTGGPKSVYPPAPTSVTLPAGITLPAGPTVYAPSVDALFIAPSGFACTATTGEDDLRTVTLVDPTNPAHFVVFNGGGSVQQVTPGCSYFPAQRAVPPESYSYCPAPPASVSYVALPTGSAMTQAAAVAVPTGVAAPWVDGKSLATFAKPTASNVPMVALFVAVWSIQTGGGANELRCALPASQSAVCDASLQLTLDTSRVEQKAPARAALQRFLAAHS